jgi:hypothetical protein
MANKKAKTATETKSDETIVPGANFLANADAYWIKAKELGILAQTATVNANQAEVNISLGWQEAVKSGFIADTVDNAKRWVRDSFTGTKPMTEGTIGVKASVLRAWSCPAFSAMTIDFAAIISKLEPMSKSERGDKSPANVLTKFAQAVKTAVDEKKDVPAATFEEMVRIANVKKVVEEKKTETVVADSPEVAALRKRDETRAAFVAQTKSLIEIDKSIDDTLKAQLLAFIAKFSPAPAEPAKLAA